MIPKCSCQNFDFLSDFEHDVEDVVIYSAHSLKSASSQLRLHIYVLCTVTCQICLRSPFQSLSPDIVDFYTVNVQLSSYPAPPLLKNNLRDLIKKNVCL